MNLDRNVHPIQITGSLISVGHNPIVDMSTVILEFGEHKSSFEFIVTRETAIQLAPHLYSEITLKFREIAFDTKPIAMPVERGGS